MSHENVENLRAILEVWSPEEWARGEGIALLDPECIFEDGILLDQVGDTYRGPEGVARALRQWMESLEEGTTIELERIVGSDDPLVGILRFHGKAKHTGIEFEMTYSCVYRFREGKVIYMKTFLDTQQALEAAGLAE